jgi:hypothetical protein
MLILCLTYLLALVASIPEKVMRDFGINYKWFDNIVLSIELFILEIAKRIATEEGKKLIIEAIEKAKYLKENY